MRQGRQLYVERCDGCHSLPRLHKYAPEDWPAWMDSMRTEFREAGAEWDQRTEALILNYLSVASGHLRDSLASLASGQSQTANPD